MRKKKNAFTLIELIAVLVILAIIALIVTPLVMNIVKKAKDSANKRSVDGYGKAVELAVATYLLDNGDYPTTLDDLTVEYTGNEVVCNVKTLNEDGGVYLSECSVKGTEVKDSNNEDGYYHYGNLSIGEVGDSESDSKYSIGDVVTYNGMEFYVIENSDENSDRLTLLKAEPLTVDEVNTYGGVGTDNNHVNMYVTDDTDYSWYQTAEEENGYGGMAYYSSSTCGLVGSYVNTGCTTDYDVSEVKYVVDAWANDKINELDLIEDNLGYKTRLLTFEELVNNFDYYESEYENEDEGTVHVMFEKSENTPSWLYNENYSYWTMSAYVELPNYYMWYVTNNGRVKNRYVYYSGIVVRPVITLLKSAI